MTHLLTQVIQGSRERPLTLDFALPPNELAQTAARSREFSIELTEPGPLGLTFAPNRANQSIELIGLGAGRQGERQALLRAAVPVLSSGQRAPSGAGRLVRQPRPTTGWAHAPPSCAAPRAVCGGVGPVRAQTTYVQTNRRCYSRCPVKM
jgi:hypothetical protein